MTTTGHLMIKTKAVIIKKHKKIRPGVGVSNHYFFNEYTVELETEDGLRIVIYPDNVTMEDVGIVL